MAFKAKSYPYPLLAGFTGDFVDPFALEPSFELNVDSQNDKLDINVSWDHSLIPPTLIDRVVDGNAEYFLNVECSATIKRWLLPIGEGNKCTLPLSELLGDFVITLVIINTGNEPFEPALNDEIVSDFSGASEFDLKVSDPLAISDSWTHNLGFQGKRSNSLLKLQFVADREENSYTVRTDQQQLVVIAGDQLQVPLSAMWNTPSLKPAFAMSVAKDAIVTGLLALSDQNDEDSDEVEWKETLLYKLNELGKELPTTFEQANETAQLIVEKSGIEKLVANNG